MELDDNSQINDEQRRLAETKKLVLQPMHPNITPENTANPNDTSSINTQPIANIASDTEQNSAPIKPAKTTSTSNKKHTAIFASVILISAGLVFIVGLAIAYL